MAHPNEKMLRDADEASQRGDFEAFFAPFADDVIAHVGGRSKLAGELKGKKALQETFQKFLVALGGDAEMETHDILANDKHGVMMQTYRGTKKGKSIEARGIAIANFDGGKISEVWFFDEDPYTSDPFYDM
jgi:ketosteroid isomerase-like protein